MTDTEYVAAKAAAAAQYDLDQDAARDEAASEAAWHRYVDAIGDAERRHSAAFVAHRKQVANA